MKHHTAKPISSKKLNNRSILFRILVFNTIFIFSTLIIMTVNNISVKTITINEIKEMNENFVNFISDTLDAKFYQVKKLAWILGDETDIKYIAVRDRQTNEDLIRFRKIIEKLSEAKTQEPIIDDIVVYFNNFKKVLSSEGSFDEDFFFKKYLLNSKNNSSQSTKNRYMLFNGKDIRKLGSTQRYKKYKVITYANNINDSAYIEVMINEERIKSLISKSNYDKDNIIVILDDFGGVLSSNADISRLKINTSELLNAGKLAKKGESLNIKLSGQEYYINFTHSSLNDVNYFVIFPMKSVVEKAAAVNRNTIYILLVLILLGIVMTIILRKEILVPIYSIMKALNIREEESERGKNELDRIHDKIHCINRENENALITIEKQRPLMEEIYLNRLLEDIKNPPDGMALYKLNSKFKKYFVLAVVIEEKDPELRKSVMVRLENIIDERLTVKKLYTHSKENLYIVKSEEEKTDFFEEVFITEFPVFTKILCGISNTHDDILNLKKACDESIFALTHRNTDSTVRRVFSFEDTKISQKENPIKVLDEEIRLVNLINSGNSEGIIKLLEELKDRYSPMNFMQKRDAYIYLANLLLMTMANKSMELENIFGMQEKDIITQLKDSYDIDYITAIVGEMYITAAKHCANEDKEYIGYICKYIDENLEKGVFLDEISERLGLSTSYVSTYFKKMKGVNFLTYVNKLKLNKAKELLTSTDKSVNCISESLGFSDTNTFIRLFKKYEGVTPGWYKRDNSLKK